jgi:peroxiredoxin
MKPLLPLLLLLLACGLLPGRAAAQQPFSYSISGHLGPLPPTAVVFVRDNQRITDSAHVRAGHFTLRGTAQQPHSILLLLVGEGRLPSIYRHSTYVTGDARRLFIEPTPVVLTSAGQLYNATLRGGPVNQEFARYTAQLLALHDQLYPKRTQYETITLDLKAIQRQQPFYDNLTRTFIQQHPASWVSLDLLTQRRLGPAQYEVVAPLYARLSPLLQHSPLGRTYGQLVDSLRTVALGATAPNLTLTTPAGKVVTVAGYRGQYLLVQFWSSQCECHLMLDPLAAIGRRFADLPLALLNVSVDEPGQQKLWRRGLSEYQLPGTAASNLDGLAGPTAQRYRLDQVPQNFLLDPTGHIVGVNLYGDELAAALAKVRPVVSPAGSK